VDLFFSQRTKELADLAAAVDQLPLFGQGGDELPKLQLRLVALRRQADVAKHKGKFVIAAGCDTKGRAGGKLSMGIGGINSSVISRPWDDEWVENHFKPSAGPDPSSNE